MNNRRSTYFAFQGLLMAVLLLLFLKQYQIVEGWVEKFSFLLVFLGGSLVFLRMASSETLSLWWVQAGLFLGDTALASLTLNWTQPQSELYLVYFIIIFGTALTRSLTQSFFVALITSLMFLISSWRPHHGFPEDSGFLLRILFLWITSALLAILSRDSQQTLSDKESQHQKRLIEIERLAALGQVAGEVAHRIKGPLTTILVNAEILSHNLSRSKAALKELNQIQQEVGHCKEILKNLLDLGRIEEMDLSPLDLRDSLLSAIKSMEPQILKKDITLQKKNLRTPLMVLGDQSLLHEAIAAVLQNAIDATPPGGTISLAIASTRSSSWWPPAQPLAYRLAIQDNGKGIEPENMERIFKAFFTTKGKEGSGLGLSATLRILQKHNGTIETYSDGPGLGARFTLVIPKLQPQKQA